MSTRDLLSYRKDVTSQWGEDGVIERIFQILKKDRDYWCCEFGAYDGVEFSNTWNLIKNKKWSGVLIEADVRRYRQLTKNYEKEKDRVSCIRAFVTFSGKDSLDSIFARTKIPKNFDFMSIDIDGNDYHIWESLKKYAPKVVMVEFNCSIPSNIEFVQAKDMSVRQGASLRSFTNLAKKKGYELIYAYDGNAIYVLKKYFPLFGIKDNSLEHLYTDHKYETQLYQFYDGTIVIEGNKKLLWHGVEFNERKMQVLPRYLRGFVDEGMPLKSLFITFLRMIRVYKPYVPVSYLFRKDKLKAVWKHFAFSRFKKR